jgi:hypothetical protein
MKNVRIIPSKPKENKTLRVAAYCRVSTSGPEQMRSLEIQISAYTKMIKIVFSTKGVPEGYDIYFTHSRQQVHSCD